MVLQEPEEDLDDGVELGKGGGFLQRREAELKAKKEEAIRLKMVCVRCVSVKLSYDAI